MKDIEIAKKYLEEENLAIAVVKDGNLIFKSHDKGIKPMYTLATQMVEMTKGSSIADKVIGRGAAMLCDSLYVKEVYGKLISDNAIEVLKKSGIIFSYGNICDYIKNRDGTDICPIEKIALQSENSEVLLSKIKGFFKAASR
ncbi:conserved hypothetical protein [[Clostridium] ultunense Esp]|uniref:DUF1893 domain-containing protein n=1 Tax=[Clostridium] ultunense Esp TaxID=1288971 RepID=M1ZDW3_9FIRM|nr:DUF1893 domain-containing protein [Schnuerera ultunensis]CCQ96796.1 conserved hypothetical protein [[Clostridium] ultunense Esp]SHD75560.1 conserved protein of unknown function [[Clostridium] ultunense Esp]